MDNEPSTYYVLMTRPVRAYIGELPIQLEVALKAAMRWELGTSGPGITIEQRHGMQLYRTRLSTGHMVLYRVATDLERDALGIKLPVAYIVHSLR